MCSIISACDLIN